MRRTIHVVLTGNRVGQGAGWGWSFDLNLVGQSERNAQLMFARKASDQLRDGVCWVEVPVEGFAFVRGSCLMSTDGRMMRAEQIQDLERIACQWVTERLNDFAEMRGAA